MRTLNSEINRLEKESPKVEGKLYVTELVVCKSAAGYYVGDYCIEWHKNKGFVMPYSNCSYQYHSTKEGAEKELEHYLDDEDYDV